METTNGSFIALIVNEGSDWIRHKMDGFMNILKLLMPDRFYQADSSVNGYTFDSIRFDLYNRYAEKVFVFNS